MIVDYQQKGDFMKKFLKTIIPIIVIVAALILFLNWANKTEKYECEIEEIQSGIYARYQSTASSIPADNYEIITVCINGQLITYEGNVEFIFVENENKIKVTEKPNIVHSDTLLCLATSKYISITISLTICLLRQKYLKYCLELASTTREQLRPLICLATQNKLHLRVRLEWRVYIQIKSKIAMTIIITSRQLVNNWLSFLI